MWFDLHYPVGKSPEYSHLRQSTTNKYGFVFTVVLVVLVAAIPIHKTLLALGYSVQLLSTLLKKITPRVARDRSYFQIFGLVALITFLSVTDIYGGDLIFLAKRLGRLSAISLPTVLFLLLRPSPLPNTLYLTLLPLHKWLSRIIIVQAVVHTFLYLGFFQFNNGWKKAWKRENLYGWAALLGFLVIVVTSVLRARNRFYRVFYFNHYVWTWIIVLSLQIHVRPWKITAYTYTNLAILVGQAWYRLHLTRTSGKTDFRVVDVSPTLSYVEFPNTLLAKKARKPGAHIRVTNYHPHFLVRLYKQIIPNYHPYTLVSLPLDRYQKLIIRKSSFTLENLHQYIIYGSFDPHLLFIKTKKSSDDFSIAKLAINAKKILVVVGGSAISIALPILRVMNYYGIMIKIIWVVKDFRDISILKFFDGFVHSDDFEIFITGENPTSYGSILSSRTANTSDLENEPLLSSLVDYQKVMEEHENENVEIADIGEEDDTCCENTGSHTETHIEYDHDDTNDTNDINNDADCVSRKSGRSSRSSTNEQFIPALSDRSSQTQQFKETVARLNLAHKLYKGRPKLNQRYFNWCVNEEDIFTQCSGPVTDETGENLICCRDLPRRHGSILNSSLTPDASKTWVISAGPKALVNNVKVWANENGLKFHEEAFYV